MRFNVTLIDPPAYKFAHLLTDIVRTTAYGLRDLGHEANLTVNHIDGDATNIIFGMHLLTADEATSIANSGARYIPVQTEHLQIDAASGEIHGFFQGNQFEAMFARLMQNAETVWEGYTDLAVYRKMGVPTERVRRFRPGYARDLEDIQHRAFPCKDIDVLFFGSVTPYRSQILNTLQGMRVATFEFGPSAFRNDMIARAKLNVSLHATPQTDYFPQPRTAYLLNNKACVVAETSSDWPPMRALVTETSTQDFADCCRQLLDTPRELESRAQSGYEGFKSMPMSDVLAELL
jgi:hypothetical protein